MIYFADLHVHSKYSRATSPDCDLVNLDRWAGIKGVSVVATGDFTHPEWRKEILENLQEDGTGLLRLKKEKRCRLPQKQTSQQTGDVRFILNVEISSIYKKNGRVRKIHNLVFMPDVESMNRFCSKLKSVGNLNSDGRPILGLDSRNLLEMALEASENSFVVPAHIWTPWFSLLGSRSGFDSVEECFEDLSSHIFALETGLSSDPDMNRKVSSLDQYTLISNSDTHSASKMGREVNIFSGKPGYLAIRDSLKKGGPGRLTPVDSISPFKALTEERNIIEGDGSFLGTIEFYPEEGKYHWDGHRKCGIRWSPSESRAHANLCPVCGKAVTIGVVNRVETLSDRNEPVVNNKAGYFWKMVPLIEIISETLMIGTKTKKAEIIYHDMVCQLGPELMILWGCEPEAIMKSAPAVIAEAILKVRNRQVTVEPGYDGEFGRVIIK